MAQTVENDIQEALNTAEGELNRIKAAYETASNNLQDVSAQDILQQVEISGLLKEQISSILESLGITAVGKEIKDLQSALAGARAVLTRGNTLLTTANRDPHRMRYLVLLVAVGPSVGILVGLVMQALGAQGIAEISAVLGGIAAAIGSTAHWITQQSKLVSEQLAKVESANQQIEQVAERKRSEQRGKIIAAEQRLAQLIVELAAAQQERNRQQQRVETIRAELRTLSPERVLARFLQDRAESDDYRKYLGIPALIRRDFQTLSDKIRKLNEAAAVVSSRKASAEAGAEEAYINRIVLYIDDLDRCPPERVVQVLQAVHLLLAFPLFIVVVGVDARWIAHSLRRRYPGLLMTRAGLNGDPLGGSQPSSAARQATPYDYLEKIFQIPLWLTQISDEGSRSMLRGLLKTSIAAGTGAAGQTPAPQTLSPVGAGDELESPPWDASPPEPEAQQVAPGGQVQQREETPPPLNLSPENLTLQPVELQAMQQLAPILGRTPRAVKRFVNIYRLIKAGIEEEDKQTAFIAENDFRCVLFLLAVDSGIPDAARTFNNDLQSGLATGIIDLDQFLASTFVKSPVEETMQRWQGQVENWDDWRALTLTQLMGWISNVSRYSFHQE
jgi:hypothetical protein